MEVISKNTHYDFLGWRWLFIAISCALTVMTAYLWFTTGDEKFGVDFRGGRELIVKFHGKTNVADVRDAFEKGGIKEPVVQAFGNSEEDFSIRLGEAQGGEEDKQKIRDILTKVNSAGYELLKEDFVGPIVGEQIRRDAYYSIFFSLIAILIYVGARFEWSFALGGIVALFHDVIWAAGFCLLTGRPMSAGILAALLTIVGYSINDTIVIYDRIRENIGKVYKTSSKTKKDPNNSRQDMIDVMNQSVNETLSRTILTSMTAFLVCLMLWLFGGGAVSDLSFALTVGVVAGTYSSIFVACPIVLMFRKDARKAA